jgi:hypothetical protein
MLNARPRIKLTRSTKADAGRYLDPRAVFAQEKVSCDADQPVSHLFGIGFNRSATSSLTRYFRDLGLPTVHWKDGLVSRAMRGNSEAGRPILSGLDQWRVFFDMEHYDADEPLGYFKSYQRYFRQLEEELPHAYFLFNWRPWEVWVKSLFHHPIERFQLVGVLSEERLNRLYGAKRRIPTLEYLQLISDLSVHELVERLKREYQLHVEGVSTYFRGKGKLLVFDLEDLDASLDGLNCFLKRIGWYRPVRFSWENGGIDRDLSIMICCMARNDHLAETLAQTVEDNILDAKRVELVVVHFLTDERRDSILAQEIEARYARHLDSGYLRYHQNRDFPHWRAGACRQTAFWYTRGRLVYNLDCDNFTGINGGRQLLNAFELYGFDELIYLGFNGVFADGSFGRICLSERNHHRIGSYHYQLPTVWSHDDSFLLLQAILELKVRILTPNRGNCLVYIEQLLKGLGLEQSKREILERVSELGVVEQVTLNPHQGLSHSRRESFKTVAPQGDPDELNRMVSEDLSVGSRYMREYFGKQGDLLEQFRAVFETWKSRHLLADQQLGDQPLRREYPSMEEFQSRIRHQKFVFYTVFPDGERLLGLIDLLVSAFLNQILITVLIPESLFEKSYLRYPGLWVFASECQMVTLLDQAHVLIRLDPTCVVLSGSLLVRINRLFNETGRSVIRGTGDELTAKKGRISKEEADESVVEFDFQESGDLRVVESLDRHHLAPVVTSRWFLWGDPTRCEGLKIGPQELERREALKRTVESSINFLQRLGVVNAPVIDQNCHSVELRAGQIVLTYGLFCHNYLIPVRDGVKYLVWQPDQLYPIERLPYEQTIVVAHQRKTRYRTVIIRGRVDYRELLQELAALTP